MLDDTNMSEKKRTCSLCLGNGHDRRNCPEKICLVCNEKRGHPNHHKGGSCSERCLRIENGKAEKHSVEPENVEPSATTVWEEAKRIYALFTTIDELDHRFAERGMTVENREICKQAFHAIVQQLHDDEVVSQKLQSFITQLKK